MYTQKGKETNMAIPPRDEYLVRLKVTSHMVAEKRAA
jgi:hypothetical protein